MPKYVYIGGIPGVGKTTTAKELKSKFDILEYVDSGKSKYEEAKNRFGIKLSQLNQEQSFEINLDFLNKIFKNNDDKTFIIDSHYTYPVNDTFVKLFPEKYFPFDLFLLFEANAELVRQRRINRRGDADSIFLPFLEREIIEERNETERLSKNYAIPLEKICTEKPMIAVISDLKKIFIKYNLL